MNSRERVVRAIQFDNPDRIPLWLFNKDQRVGDILWYDFRVNEGEDTLSYHGGTLSEWGFEWKRLDDGTMGQPNKPVIPEWEYFNNYKFPQVNPDRRLARFEAFKKHSEGYYRLPLLITTGFTTYTFLRGFENAMIDFIEEPELSGYLLDNIFAFEKELMTLAAEAGFDGFHFGDDWGAQESLIISPDLWRRIFKPRYKEQFAHAHKLGLHVWFHSCGNIASIIEDMYEIGIDVMNIAQPNVVDIEIVGKKLKGKQCFLIPVSYQTVSISGTPEEVIAEGRRLYDLLAGENGGFIGYVEEYGCMGMSEENYRACIDAFRGLRTK